MSCSMVMDALFPSGGEAHSYNEIRRWCESSLGISERQVKGVVGYLVREGMLVVATNATNTKSAIFVR